MCAKWVRVDDTEGSYNAVIHAIAVNKEGVIGVMWLAREESAEPCSRLRFSVSTDGGRSFRESVKVSDIASCPGRSPRNAAAHAHRPLGGGDYNGLAAAADGSFHVVWADARSGIYQLHHARVVVEQ